MITSRALPLLANALSFWSLQVQCVVETEEGHTVVIGGAEPRVSFLKKTMLEKRSSTPVSPQSVYALAINSGTHNAGVREIILTEKREGSDIRARACMKKPVALRRLRTWIFTAKVSSSSRAHLGAPARVVNHQARHLL